MFILFGIAVLGLPAVMAVWWLTRGKDIARVQERFDRYCK